MTTEENGQRTYQKSKILPTCKNKVAYIFILYIWCLKFHAKEVGQGFFFFFNDKKIPKLGKMDRWVYYLGDSFPLGDFFFLL